MSWSAYNNKNLIVPKDIVLNEYLNAALVRMDSYWPPNSEKVTSGVRTPEDSLRIIRTYLKHEDLARVYPKAMTCPVDGAYTDSGEWLWQMAWSHLLNKGVIINPPLAAKCLMDYYRNGKNRKGQIIGQSPHVKGTAIDLSGIDSEVIVKRLVEDKIIRGYLVERKNNCIHLDV